jgi:hypothetical protein
MRFKAASQAVPHLPSPKRHAALSSRPALLRLARPPPDRQPSRDGQLLLHPIEMFGVDLVGNHDSTRLPPAHGAHRNATMTGELTLHAIGLPRNIIRTFSVVLDKHGDRD